MYFFSGKPCVRGHLAVRRAANNTCQQCANEQSYALWDAGRPMRHAAMAQREAEIAARRNDPAHQEEQRAKARASAQQQKQRRMQEEGTEEYYDGEAAKQRAGYWADPEKHRQRVQDRRDRGLVGTKMKRQRTPPWLEPWEREAIDKMYRSRKVGQVVDHIVPIVHEGGLVAGIHTPQNLQHITHRANLQKRNRLDCTHDDAAEYVRLGMAVWAKDINPETGAVDWSKYPRAEGW